MRSSSNLLFSNQLSRWRVALTDRRLPEVRRTMATVLAVIVLQTAHAQAPPQNDKKIVSLGVDTTLFMETRPFAPQEHNITYCDPQ